MQNCSYPEYFQTDQKLKSSTTRDLSFEYESNKVSIEQRLERINRQIQKCLRSCRISCEKYKYLIRIIEICDQIVKVNQFPYDSMKWLKDIQIEVTILQDHPQSSDLVRLYLNRLLDIINNNFLVIDLQSRISSQRDIMKSIRSLNCENLQIDFQKKYPMILQSSKIYQPNNNWKSLKNTNIGQKNQK